MRTLMRDDTEGDTIVDNSLKMDSIVWKWIEIMPSPQTYGETRWRDITIPMNTSSVNTLCLAMRFCTSIGKTPQLSCDCYSGTL